METKPGKTHGHEPHGLANGPHAVEIINLDEPDDDDIKFKKAMEQYMKDNKRPFPTWSEVLEVALALGYRKILELKELPSPHRKKAKKDP